MTEMKRVVCPDCLRAQKMPVQYEEGKEGCADCGCSIAFKRPYIGIVDGETEITYECQFCGGMHKKTLPDELPIGSLVKLTCPCGYKGSYALRPSLDGSTFATYFERETWVREVTVTP